MEIALTILVAILSLLLGVTITAYYRLRARTRDAPKPPEEPPERRASPPSLIAASNDEMDIPVDLVGPRCKEALERFAPKLGLTPVNLLRAVLIQGLVGNRPITDDLLEALDELAAEAPPSPPPSYPPH